MFRLRPKHTMDHTDIAIKHGGFARDIGDEAPERTRNEVYRWRDAPNAATRQDGKQPVTLTTRW